MISFVYKKIFTTILLVFAMLLPANLFAQQKRALVIGLGEQADASWGKINGDKDVTLVNSILKSSDFSDITTLVNKKATKNNIVRSFKSLASRCNAGDIVYVHFSGHGQQMNDFNNDESDNLDECWIPYDAYIKSSAHDRGEKHLTDDEINGLLSNIKAEIGNEGRMLVVVDACHSGDSSRGNDTLTYRGTRDMFYASEELNKRCFFPVSEKWIILSACRDYQRNAELKTDEGQFGKLTYALYSILKENRHISNKQLYNQICSFFNKNRGVLQQTPVMKGVTDRFNITDVFK